MKHIHPEHAERIISKTEKPFRLHLGAEISSIRELAEALDIMSEDTFKHHVNENKNDFAKWIEDVFNDEELAAKIRHLKSRDRIKTELIKRLKFMEKIAMQGRPLYYDEYMDHPVRDFVIGLLVGVVLGFIINYIAIVFG